MAEKVVADFSRDLKGFEIVEIIVVKNLKQMDYHLEVLQAIPDLQCVIVGSGDGTIVSILQTLKGRDITYGFLPLGTSNTFVRSLGLPLTYPLAKRLILKQQVRPASIGAVNGKVFANIAGIGIPAEVTASVTNESKKKFGLFAYIASGLKAMTGHTAIYCHVVNDEVNESFYTHYLLFANGKYHGNLSLGNEISAYNDKLVLVAMGISEKRWHFFSALFSLTLRRHKRHPKIRMIPFDRLFVTTQPSRRIEADGELISQTPATVEILKDAIRVFAKPLPKTKEGARRGNTVSNLRRRNRSQKN
jgi:diacylglycerol kinase family enzyme